MGGMNRERIIELAKESGVADWYLGADDLKSATQQRHCAKLEAFANLIAAETREECARICSDYTEWCKNWGTYKNEIIAIQVAGECAAAIRNGGK